MNENSPKSAKENLRSKLERKKAQLSDRDSHILSGKHVLFAEDDKTNAHLMMRLLSAKGIKADYAKDGETAMNMFAESAEHYYDAVILDIHMPHVNGHEAALAIRHMGRSDSRSIPIIAVTAFEGDEEKELSDDVGVSVHLNKPIDPDALYSTLEQLLPRS